MKDALTNHLRMEIVEGKISKRRFPVSGKFLDVETKKKIVTRKRKRRIAQIAVSNSLLGIVIAAVILLNVFTHVLQIVHYSGNSMEPNIHNRQTLLLLKTKDVEQGDVIAFYFNNQILVRRVICTGGNQISVESDGTVRINAEPIQEAYLTAPSIGQCNITFPYRVQEDYLFVMGDNRSISMDSRLSEIGPVPLDRVIGKVVFAI